ncbi:MAG: ATP-dependent DNA helicase RecG [Acidobacteria bacterium]|nr:ATP-dependent DNA helicase RecG [Acidobacteriota bacterium]
MQYLKGIGPRRGELLAAEGIQTAEDLLYYKPFRYEDRTHFKTIASLRDGDIAVICGRIIVAGLHTTSKSGFQIYELNVRDETGAVNIKFFNQPYLKKILLRDLVVIFYGQARVDSFRFPALCLINPEFEIIEDSPDSGLHIGRVVPVYRKVGEMTPKILRRVIYTVIENLEDEVADTLPPYLVHKYNFLSRQTALTQVHFPDIPSTDPAARSRALEELCNQRSPAHQRLIFDEFFQLQVGLLHRKRLREKAVRQRSYHIDDHVRNVVRSILTFHPTTAQKRVLREIVDDLRSARPLNRLVQGDVGCGKTIVALQAIIIAIENGYQAALMAPTEILAEQHYLTIRRFLASTGYRVGLLTAGVKKRLKEELRGQIADGTIQLVIGTHAILQEEVVFKNLGFVVIDEQHRFGVLQRSTLMKKTAAPDTLVMTATPIPRSLALTIYGDLDLSIIDELPPGRRPIRTLLRADDERAEVYELIRQTVERKEQVYVVYPLVEESEKVDLKAAKQMAEHLAQAIFPQLRIGLLHGRMKGMEKDEVMRRFVEGDLDILVATTVIEVGIDVARATLMVIEHAERFGLAQLHQLRGRVGRGAAASTCALLIDRATAPDTRKRLAIMAESNDGFKIAELDLELRGPGEFAGTRQSGIPEFRFGNIVRDRQLLELAREEAAQFLDRMARAPEPALVQVYKAIRQTWEKWFGLIDVG